MGTPSTATNHNELQRRSPPTSLRKLVDAELVASVSWLIRIRWIAGLCVVLATWILEVVFGLDTAEGALYVIGAGILAYNLIFYLVERRLDRKMAPIAEYDLLAKWQVGLDWIAMTLLIHFSGGIESPAILFFFFHIIIASILFPQRTAFSFAMLAIGLVSATALLEYVGFLPHDSIVGFLASPLYRNPLYVGAMLLFFASASLIIVYLTSSIQDRLRQREGEVVELTDNLQRATTRLQALNEGALTVNSTLDLTQVLDRLVKSSAEAMGVRACSIRLLDRSGKRLEPVAVYGLSQAYLDKGPVEVDANPLAREVLAGYIVNVPDALTSPLLQYPEEARQEGIRSMLSAPLAGKDHPLGILRAYAIEPQRFTDEDEAFLAAIAAQGSIAIENAMAYQAVEDLDEAKSQFVRMVTHELRSPVSVIRSLLRTMSGGFAGDISEQQQDIIERVARRADYLQGLIDDLLDLAAGKMDVRNERILQPLSLSDAVERVVKRYEVSASEKGLTLKWIDGSAGKQAIVKATPEDLDRIFNNLISNAVKYTRTGGRVTVLLACLGDEIRVTVQDSGIGIPEEAMEHLFEEFYRAPNAKELEREGTGLGLTIARDTVTHLGGKISVESEHNIGTQITVVLPAYKDEETPGTMPDQPSAHP